MVSEVSYYHLKKKFIIQYYLFNKNQKSQRAMEKGRSGGDMERGVKQ